MKEKVSYINKSFKKAIIVLCLFAISLIAELLSIFFINEIIDSFREIPIIIASLVGIVGLIQGIKGMREKKNAKVIFSVIINSIFVAILLFLIITIIIDISTT